MGETREYKEEERVELIRVEEKGREGRYLEKQADLCMEGCFSLPPTHHHPLASRTLLLELDLHI